MSLLSTFMAGASQQFSNVTGTEVFVCDGESYNGISDAVTLESEKSPGYYTPEDSAQVLVTVDQIAANQTFAKKANCTWRSKSWKLDRCSKGQFAWTFYLIPATKRDGLS